MSNIIEIINGADTFKIKYPNKTEFETKNRTYQLSHNVYEFDKLSESQENDLVINATHKFNDDKTKALFWNARLIMISVDGIIFTTYEELSEVLEMSENDIKESMKNSGRHISMDAPLVEGEDSNLYDVLRSGESPSPDMELMLESLRTEIERALSTLTQREADLIKLYFGLNGSHPMTLEEIGDTFDLTRERVRQIKEKAIRRLKHTTRSKILKSYISR